MKMLQGWFNESKRHSLARMGYKTGRAIRYNAARPEVNNSISDWVLWHPNLLPHWTSAMSLREIIGNALAAVNNDKDSVRIEFEDKDLIIEDDGIGLQKRHFLPGKTEFVGSPSIFGVGFKEGCSVLTREGSKVWITTNGKVYTFKIEYSKDFDDKVVKIYQYNDQAYDGEGGTKYHISNVKKEDLDTAKKLFIAWRDDWDVLDSVETGILNVEIGDVETAGGDFIAVNGQIIGSDQESKRDEQNQTILSYNLITKNEELMRKVWNRDKTLANYGEIKPLITTAINNTKNEQVIEKVLQALDNKKMRCIENNNSYYPEHKDVWKKVLHDTFGEKIAIASDDNEINTQLQYQSYNILNWNWEGESLLERLNIPKAIDLLKFHEHIKVYKTKDLTSIEIDILKNAKKILTPVWNRWDKQKNHELSKDGINYDFMGGPDAKKEKSNAYSGVLMGDIKIVEDFGKNHEGVLGRYDRETDTIFIKRSELDSIKDTVHILNEELLHKHRRVLDRTREFQHESLDQSSTIYKQKQKTIAEPVKQEELV